MGTALKNMLRNCIYYSRRLCNSLKHRTICPFQGAKGMYIQQE